MCVLCQSMDAHVLICFFVHVVATILLLSMSKLKRVDVTFELFNILEYLC
jgi:hypothetical protein